MEATLSETAQDTSTLEKIKREIKALFDENESLKNQVRDLELGNAALTKAIEALFYHGNPSIVRKPEQLPTQATTKKPWTGKLHHSQNASDDWGFVRDETGELILIVKANINLSLESLETHRRNHTDPTQDRVDYLLEALNA